MELVLVKPKSRQELHRNLNAKTGVHAEPPISVSCMGPNHLLCKAPQICNLFILSVRV